MARRATEGSHASHASTMTGKQTPCGRFGDDDAKQGAFYNCWTRKEAYIKAKSEGMSIPLNQFDVSCLPGEPAALLQSREDSHEIMRWALRELAPGREWQN
jgi:phosphopantetheinyl transferase